MANWQTNQCRPYSLARVTSSSVIAARNYRRCGINRETVRLILAMRLQDAHTHKIKEAVWMGGERRLDALSDVTWRQKTSLIRLVYLPAVWVWWHYTILSICTFVHLHWCTLTQKRHSINHRWLLLIDLHVL